LVGPSPERTMEDAPMVWYRMAVTAFVIVALAAVGRLVADDPKAAPPAKGQHDRLEAMAAKLGLNDKQKEDIKSIHTDFEKKAGDLEHQLFGLHHEEHEAMSKVLTDDQRAKVPGLLKSMRDKELEKIAGELGLSADQTKKLEAVREEREPKFHEVAAQQGDEARARFHELRHELFEAIGKELTAEQKEKLPGVLREEYHQWRDPVARREHLKALGAELGLNDDQKEQIKKIHKEFDTKTEPLTIRIKQVHDDEHTAVNEVLTPEQRTMLADLRKARTEGEKKPSDK